MNYTMGRYIESLTDEQRDRLVSAEDFETGAMWWDPAMHAGCLVGTVHHGAWDRISADESVIAWDKLCLSIGIGEGRYAWNNLPPHHRFHYAVTRFGKARVVRAIKLRAAATTSVAAESRALEGVR